MFDSPVWLIYVLFVATIGAVFWYWIIRLAVRHGTLDAYRIDRVDQRVAERSAATVRQQLTHGGAEPE